MYDYRDAVIYDYCGAVKRDVCKWMENNREEVEAKRAEGNEFAFEDWIIEECMNRDDVTGNASGSYTFDIWEAEKCLCYNIDFLVSLFDGIEGGTERIGEIIMRGPEYCDVFIRCCVLPDVVADAIEEFFREK